MLNGIFPYPLTSFYRSHIMQKKNYFFQEKSQFKWTLPSDGKTE